MYSSSNCHARQQNNSLPDLNLLVYILYVLAELTAVFQSNLLSWGEEIKEQGKILLLSGGRVAIVPEK